ncbi:hydroxyisourate hydrolase [Microbacterium aureliae]
MTSHLTTHVLDAATGLPAASVSIVLSHVRDDGTVTPLAEQATGADGRAALGPQRLDPGVYTLTFATGAYFAARGIESFYPAVIVTFTVAAEPHLHVPLLLSPFAYSTYRGS